MAISTPVTGLKPDAGSRPEIRQRTQQVLQQTAQARHLPPDQQNDQTQLSDELVGEVENALKTQGNTPGQDLDTLIAGLAQNFVERQVPQPGSAEATKAAPGVGGVDQARPKKEITATWKPEVRETQVIPPQGKIGEITLKEETRPGTPEDQAATSNGKNGKPGGKGKAGQTGGAESAQAAAAPRNVGAAHPPNKVGAAQGAAPAQKSQGATRSPKSPAGSDGAEDQVEFSQETEELARQMAARGMKPPEGLDPSSPASQGGPPGSGNKTKEVLMPSEGMTQAVRVRPPGPLDQNGPSWLMTYRKLDDMPAGNVAILKDKTGQEIVEEERRRIERGEKVQPLSPSQRQQLLNPTATSQ